MVDVKVQVHEIAMAEIRSVPCARVREEFWYALLPMPFCAADSVKGMEHVIKMAETQRVQFAAALAGYSVIRRPLFALSAKGQEVEIEMVVSLSVKFAMG